MRDWEKASDDVQAWTEMLSLFEVATPGGEAPRLIVRRLLQADPQRVGGFEDHYSVAFPGDLPSCGDIGPETSWHMVGASAVVAFQREIVDFVFGEEAATNLELFLTAQIDQNRELNSILEGQLHPLKALDFQCTHDQRTWDKAERFALEYCTIADFALIAKWIGKERAVLLERSPAAEVERSKGSDIGQNTSPNDEATPEFTADAKALAALVDNPDASDKEIARIAGISRGHLYRLPKFKLAKTALRGTSNIPRGSKYGQKIEAIEPDED